MSLLTVNGGGRKAEEEASELKITMTIDPAGFVESLIMNLLIYLL